MPSNTPKTPSQWLAAFDQTGVLTGDTKNGGDEHVAYCPNCEDPDESNSASASFNFKKMSFHCFSCKKQFPFKELLGYAREEARERRAAAKGGKGESKKGSKKKLSEEPLPGPSQLARWKAALWSSPSILQAFKDKRGLSNEIIEQYGLGYRADKKRFTLPVYDINGELVNVRYYGPTSKAKMINHTGHGEARLLGHEALEHDEILLVEGEMDWLTGLDQGFDTMTWTSGVSSWQDKWSAMFEGKTVFLCFDDDEAGRQGARKVALSLDRAGAKCHIVQLAIANIKGGDLTDYFHNLGNTADDFRETMEDARHTVAGRVKRDKPSAGEPEDISVEAMADNENTGKPLSMVATVHGKAVAPYILPKRVEYVCNQDWGDHCKKCGLDVFGGKREVAMEADDRDLFGMVGRTDEQVRKTVLKFADIPVNCPKVDPEVLETWTVEELQVMPSVEHRSEEMVNPVNRTVYNFGVNDRLQINKTYRITGLSTPHPRDQSHSFQAWDVQPVEVDIERFKMDEDIYEQLQIFTPDEWQDETPWQKLRHIADDMSINVTRIFGRPELHIGYDLVWHSVNSFYYGGQLQVRGWVEGLVIGDTRTGKSEVSHRLMDHYRSGALVMADRASFAGLIGGASQKGASKQWGITWGVIPLNDKRLVILDEAGGISPQDISAMSSVRSQGVAEITKMGGQKTSARTRLIWIANPITKRPIIEMAEGAMDEIGEFIPTPEDVARFDFAMAAASGDVNKQIIGVERKRETPHLHLTEDCKQLITWCWSRKPEQVIFVDDTEEYIYQKALDFSDVYVEDLPLVQQQSFDLKLARLSVAVAARLFSTDETGENVLVGHEHVDTALQFLNMIYGMDSFGYRNYSLRKREEVTRARNNREKAKDLLWEDDGIRATLLRVMSGGKFKNRDFEERGGMMREEAQQAADQLMDLGMLQSMSRGYLKMTPVLLEIMRDIRRDVEAALDQEAREEAE